jgi:hypothetical protein
LRDELTRIFPYGWLHRLRSGLFAWRRLTRRRRGLPEFILAGAQRSGTTTLYDYLAKHPLVLRAFSQEVHFFDDNFGRGVDWYRAHFPLESQRKRVSRRFRGRAVTGEASGYYLLHPHAPRRIAETLPEAKIIVILRNPIERAWAHYHQSVNKGETLSFDEAIRSESSRLAGEREKMLEDESYVSVAYRRYSYLTRGLYAEQLARLRSYVPEERVLVLRSEDLLFNDPAGVVRDTLAFLGLPEAPIETAPRRRDFYPPIPEETRAWLADHFREPNRRLSQQEGMDFGWDEVSS